MSQSEITSRPVTDFLLLPEFQQHPEAIFKALDKTESLVLKVLLKTDHAMNTTEVLYAVIVRILEERKKQTPSIRIKYTLRTREGELIGTGDHSIDELIAFFKGKFSEKERAKMFKVLSSPDYPDVPSYHKIQTSLKELCNMNLILHRQLSERSTPEGKPSIVYFINPETEKLLKK